MQVALGSGRLALPWSIYAVTGLGLGALWTFLSAWPGLRTRLGAAPEAEVARIQVYRPGYPAPPEGLPVGGRRAEGPED